MPEVVVPNVLERHGTIRINQPHLNGLLEKFTRLASPHNVEKHTVTDEEMGQLKAEGLKLADTLRMDVEYVTGVLVGDRCDEAHSINSAIPILRGADEYRCMLKEKWTGMSVTAALLLTITLPASIAPPFEEPKAMRYIFAAIMLLASACGIGAVLTGVLWLDKLNTFCPSNTDVYYFATLSYVNDPYFLMQTAMQLTFVGFAVTFAAIYGTVGIVVCIVSLVVTVIVNYRVECLHASLSLRHHAKYKFWGET